MNREKINVSDLATNAEYPNDDDLCIDDWDTCKCVFRKEENFDSEKGFIDYEVVVQRLTDGKYFKFTYTQFGHNGDDSREQTAVEVFPVEKTVIVFE